MPPNSLVLGAFLSLVVLFCFATGADAISAQHLRSRQHTQIRVEAGAQVLPRAVLANQPAPTASWIAPPVQLPPPAEIPSAPQPSAAPAPTNSSEECEQCGCGQASGPKMVDGTCKHHRFPYKAGARADLKDLEDQHAADDAAAKKTQLVNATAIDGSKVIASNAFVLEPNAVPNPKDGSVVVPSYNYHASNLPTIPAPPQPAPSRVQSSTLPSKGSAQAPAPAPSAPTAVPAGALQPSPAPVIQTAAASPKAAALLETGHILLGTDGPEDLNDLIRQSKISFTPMQDWEKARAVRTFADADQYELFEARKEHRKPFWEIKIPVVAAAPKPLNATEIVAAAAGVNVGAQVTKKRRKIIKIIQRRRTHISDELINDPRVKKIIAENPEEAKWTNDVVDIQGNVVPVGDNGTIAIAVDAPDAAAASPVIPGVSPRFRAMVEPPEDIPKWGPKGKFNPINEDDQVRMAIATIDFTPREGVPRWTQSPGHKMFEQPKPTPEELKTQQLEALVSASAKAVAQMEPANQRFMQTAPTPQAQTQTNAEAEVEGEMSLSDD